MKSVAILGGGISGLSAAFHLLKHSRKIGLPIQKIRIFESKDRFGGWMQSVRYGKETEDFFDVGPRTIRTSTLAGTDVIAMVSEIGLSDKVRAVTNKSKNFNKRFIVLNGKLRQLPSSLKDLFRADSPFKPFAIYLLNDLRAGRLRVDDDLSVDQFFRRRFGSDIADYLINPMCIGITGGNSKDLSIKSVFPDLFKGEQKHGSVVKSMFFSKTDRFQDLRNNPLVQRSIRERWSVLSFQGGIGTFSDSLAKYLQDHNVELITGTSIQNLNFKNSKCDIDHQLYDHVFSALPAYAFSSILPQQNSELKNALLKIPFVDMAIVSFRYSNKVKLPSNMNGFGFLVPSHENSPLLGVIYDSSIFEDESSTKFTAMLGGYRFKELFGSPESVSKDHLAQVSQRALSQYLNIDAKPIETMVSVHRQCIPQYTLGHSRRVSNIERLTAELPLSLIGSSYHGFSVPDCVHNAKLQAIKYVESLKVCYS